MTTSPTMHRYRSIALMTLGLTLAAPLAQAGPCADVVDDTIAEMRAGAAGAWNDEVEKLVATAAGSACVKARSGRYGEELQSAPVAVAPEAADDDEEAATMASEAPEATADDDGSWSVGGLTFRSMSGSPGKKPYERSRNNDD